MIKIQYESVTHLLHSLSLLLRLFGKQLPLTLVPVTFLHPLIEAGSGVRGGFS